MEHFYQVVAKVIRSKVEAAGMSQRAFSKAMGLAPTVGKNRLDGVHRFTFDEMRCAAEVLDTDAWKLIREAEQLFGSTTPQIA